MAGSPRVFVSHAHADNAFTHQFVAVLQNAGLDVWYDVHNLAAGSFTDAIERELAARPIFIVLLSPAALASRWVEEEVKWAYNLLRRDSARIILPVVAAPVPHQDIWLFLDDFRRIENKEGTPYSPVEAGQRVLQALALTSPSVSEDVETLIARGMTLRANGDLTSAIDVLTLATQRAPMSTDAWISYGLALTEARRYDEALATFDRALNLDQGSELAIRSKADTLLSLGRYIEAIQMYDRALARNPNYVTAWYNRGTALSALGRYEEAIENYQTLQRLDPQNSDAYMFQADALWRVGHRRRAIDAFEQALEIKPGSLKDLTRPIRILIRRYQ